MFKVSSVSVSDLIEELFHIQKITIALIFLQGLEEPLLTYSFTFKQIYDRICHQSVKSM